MVEESTQAWELPVEEGAYTSYVYPATYPMTRLLGQAPAGSTGSGNTCVGVKDERVV